MPKAVGNTYASSLHSQGEPGTPIAAIKAILTHYLNLMCRFTRVRIVSECLVNVDFKCLAIPPTCLFIMVFQDRQLKIKDMVLSSHDRAVRNCPWTMGLWKSYVLALERHGADHNTVSGKYSS